MKVYRNQPDLEIIPFSEHDISRTLTQRFSRIAGLYPDRTAVKTGDVETSYTKLNRLSEQIAIFLFRNNVDTSRPIALFLEQGDRFISALLGVLRYGGFFVALDPENPEIRNRHILEDAGSTTLIVSKDLTVQADEMFAGRGELIVYDEMFSGLNDALPELPLNDAGLAFILYTSGSTGVPKGVMHTHNNVLHNTMRHTNAFRINEYDRQTLLYNCGVYGGMRDIFNALLNGASVHVYSVKRNGISGLPQWLKQERITIYCSVATVFRYLAKLLDESEMFHDVRLLKLGSEASFKTDVDMFKAHFPPRSVMHCGYGSTETGIVRHFFVTHDTEIAGHVVPLGYAIEDMDVLLLDEQGNHVVAGQAGEIAVKSRYVAPGYWNYSELTASRFIADAEDPQVRVYLTGDQGMLDPDGCLINRGRKDHQVKIRGNRVELGDVEHTLLQIDDIEDACVVLNENNFNEPCLVAYYIARDGSSVEAAELREKARNYLPEFMVPTLFMEMQSFPLLPNSKLDRSSLPRPKMEQLVDSTGPGSELEEGILEIWSDVFGTERIGVQTDFFSIGGNSLLITQINSRILNKYGVGLELVDLFSSPTVRQQALLVLEKLESISEQES
jgi:amino acid adenylation domain-containing protein